MENVLCDWAAKMGKIFFFIKPANKNSEKKYRLSTTKVSITEICRRTLHIFYMKNKITRHLSQDPVMARLTKNHPFPENIVPVSVYERLLTSIISQQLSTKVADVIRGRFLDLFEDGYPDRERLLSMDMDTLRSVGLSRQKASYLQNVAEGQWHDMGDEAIIDYLTQIKGVGRWTVQMNLMFNLQRPDVFPVDDLGIQNAMIALYQLAGTRREIKQEMHKVAEPWRPYRTYACWYLWRSLDG